MNHAFCLLSTNLKKEVQEALNIYEDLEVKYPEYLLVKMRLAQAYGKNMAIDLCLKKCEEAYKMYNDVEKQGFVDREELPEADFNHIREHLPKIYGYYLWMKSENYVVNDAISGTRRVMVLRKAYLLTQRSLLNAPENISLYNNLLYYALEIAKIVKRYPKIKVKKDILQSIERYLEELEKRINIDETEKINILDTFAKVYHFLGKRDKLTKVLDRLIPLAERSLSKLGCDNEIIEATIKEASAMKAEISAN